MPFILCHGPKGGAGTSFLTAHLALALAEAGHAVTAIDMTRQDSLKLYFGLTPIQAIPDFDAPDDQARVIAGVSLRQGFRAAHAPAFADALVQGEVPLSGEPFILADVATDDITLRDLLLPHAALTAIPVMPTALGMTALTQALPGTPLLEMEYTAFVINRLDETRRFARNAHSFLRELLGGKLLGAIHEDEAANEATAMGQLLPKFAPASAAMKDIRTLAAAIVEVCGPPRTTEAAA